MELSWTGKSKELSSGNSWAVTCEEGELGDKMVIEVDVTKFRVQPFRSYKVCISLEDSPTDSHLDEVCTHLFSFEKYVPYVPEQPEVQINIIDQIKSDVKDTDIIVKKTEKVIVPKIMSEIEDIESVLKQQLDDIDNYVRDDFKSQFLELKDEIVGEVEQKMIHSSSSELNLSIGIFLFLMILTL